MKFVSLVFVALLSIVSLCASADSLPQLTQYLQSEIAHSSQALSKPVGGLASDQEEFFLRRWLVRLQASFGIEVPWIASFQIVPEVELVWQRPYPDGWTDYKPHP